MILVTGATGLVGSHLLVKLLQNEVAVRAIFRKNEGIEAVKNVFDHYNQSFLFNKIEWIKADINDIPSLEKAFVNISKVYHCAAYISFKPKDNFKLQKINIEGTANVVNCCIAFKVEKLCHVSSIAALGEAVNGKVDEESLWNSEKYHSDYALSKIASEMEVWRGAQENLKVVIVNPSVIFGYFKNSTSSSNIIKIIKKYPKFYTRGTISYIDVKDVVNVMMSLMESEIFNERYIVSSETLPLKVFIKKIAALNNLSQPKIKINRLITRIIYKIDFILSFLFFRERKFTKANHKMLQDKIYYNNSKIIKILDYNFLKLDSIFRK